MERRNGNDSYRSHYSLPFASTFVNILQPKVCLIIRSEFLLARQKVPPSFYLRWQRFYFACVRLMLIDSKADSLLFADRRWASGDASHVLIIPKRLSIQHVVTYEDVPKKMFYCWREAITMLWININIMHSSLYDSIGSFIVMKREASTTTGCWKMSFSRLQATFL